MSGELLGTLLFIAVPLTWALIVWRRLYYLVRYFQLEGYDSGRYFRWLSHQRYELIYLTITLVCIIILIFLLPTPNGGRGDYREPLATTLGSLLLLILLPRQRHIKQKFTPTSRALRLLAAAVIINLVLSISLGTFIYWLFYFSSYPITPFFSLLLKVTYVHSLWVDVGGAIAVFLVSFTIPLANIILWPVEEAFRRYYLRLAKQHLKRSGATVIAITGSYGKTSTKHYLNHILGGRFRVLMTPKSYNTLLGVSRVINDILAKDVSYDYFIVEAGAYIPGEIARICQLVEPQISMVITVGPMHLERFGSIENVVKAKYEIIESLPPDGVGIFNADDPRVHGMAERGYPQTRILITRQGANDARLSATNVQMIAEGLAFDVRDNATGEQASMRAPLYGEHNITNILMAMAVARHLGMSFPEIAMRVATLEPAEHRLHRQVLPDGTVIIDDAYSANPVGTQTALQVLALQNNKPDARRIVLSAGMFELGPISDAENRKLGERMADVATDVILIGSAQTKPVQEGLASKHFPADHLHVVNTLNEAVTIYRSLLRPGDALLVLTDLPDVYA